MKLQAKQWPLFNSEADVHIGTILSQPFIAMETIYDATKEDSDQSGKGGGARKLESPLPSPPPPAPGGGRGRGTPELCPELLLGSGVLSGDRGELSGPHRAQSRSQCSAPLGGPSQSCSTDLFCSLRKKERAPVNGKGFCRNPSTGRLGRGAEVTRVSVSRGCRNTSWGRGELKDRNLWP